MIIALETWNRGDHFHSDICDLRIIDERYVVYELCW